ncbi:Hint domain-containing protein [Roseomonas sp. HJA6]|uniref:Hint domain-containing protein n=1 Tax=Roseomonas alba TaxID=2846776 RepID=A0ABS7AAZ5_9PROT|nr:Hint domain-containing protein [Neoroseomonas alba]MBW6399474.1 Hint domain-containing protein [Neoroseomonas alba]
MTAVELGQTFTVYQIETADHELILAEGLPAETFVDNVPRSRFDNAAEYDALFGGTDTAIREMDRPRAASARQVPAAIHDRIAAIAAARMPEPKAA